MAPIRLSITFWLRDEPVTIATVPKVIVNIAANAMNSNMGLRLA
jgi:hypothetical protein